MSFGCRNVAVGMSTVSRISSIDGSVNIGLYPSQLQLEIFQPISRRYDDHVRKSMPACSIADCPFQRRRPPTTPCLAHAHRPRLTNWIKKLLPNHISTDADLLVFARLRHPRLRNSSPFGTPSTRGQKHMRILIVYSSISPKYLATI